MKPTPKTARNLEILNRHYANGETFKSISADMDVSYARVVEVAAEQRKKMLKRSGNGEAIEEIAAAFGLPTNITKEIVELEGNRTAENEARWKQFAAERQADREEEEEEYYAGLPRQALIEFRRGNSADQIAETYGLGREHVLRMIESQLAAVIADVSED